MSPRGSWAGLGSKAGLRLGSVHAGCGSSSAGELCCGLELPMGSSS